MVCLCDAGAGEAEPGSLEPCSPTNLGEFQANEMLSYLTLKNPGACSLSIHTYIHTYRHKLIHTVQHTNIYMYTYSIFTHRWREEIINRTEVSGS